MHGKFAVEMERKRELVDGGRDNREIRMVPRAGVEPARPYGQRILSLKMPVFSCSATFGFVTARPSEIRFAITTVKVDHVRNRDWNESVALLFWMRRAHGLTKAT
jgi:hypothetical protein